MRVDEDDAVEPIRHVPLEQQRNVADDDAVAALARLVDEPGAQALDLGVDDLVKFFELVVVGEDDATQRGAIEMAVGGEHGRAPALRRSCRRPAVPSSTARRASTSASMIVAPRSDSICATVDFPLPMLPVSPIRSMTDSSG